MQNLPLNYTLITTSTQFNSFLSWISTKRIVQHDVETTPVEDTSLRELVTVQFGDLDCTRQWVMYWPSLTSVQKEAVRKIIESEEIVKLAHNAQFECIVWLKEGYHPANFQCTMIFEQIILSGDVSEEYSLEALSMKYLCTKLDKQYQTAFYIGMNLTPEVLRYACTDVYVLSGIYRQQLLQLHLIDQEYVAALECAVIPAYAEMHVFGPILNQEEWLANIPKVQPIIDRSKAELDFFLTEKAFDVAKAMGFISDKDRVQINWNSSTQRGKLLQLLYPGLQKTTKPEIQKYLLTREPEDRVVLQALLQGNYQPVQDLLIEQHYDVLVAEGFLIPAYTSTINWNSIDQAKCIASIYATGRLKDMSSESIDKQTHSFFKAYVEYKEASKLVSSFGEKFIRESVDADGRVRATYNQIVSTGRTSCRKPKMLGLNKVIY